MNSSSRSTFVRTVVALVGAMFLVTGCAGNNWGGNLGNGWGGVASPPSAASGGVNTDPSDSNVYSR